MAAAQAPAELRKLPYYHGDFTRHEQIRGSLEPYLKKDGYFLLRNSIRDPSMTTISVTHGMNVYHMSVTLNEKGRFYLRDNDMFKTMADLVKYYKKHDVPNVENIKHVRLMHPISNTAKPKPEDTPQKDVLTIQKGALKGRVPSPTAQRAPIPVPRTKGGQPPRADQHYYAYAEDDVARGPLLLQRMRARDQKTDKCVCGLRLKDSVLPRSWTVHISTEDETTGRVFFVSPEEESHWQLPAEIKHRLSDKQRKFIDSLMSGNNHV